MTDTILYVGWTGQGNLGDDAIADALTPRLPNVEPWHVPVDLTGFARRVLAGGLRGAGARTLLLGGGTVIGRRNWRILLTTTGALLARRRPWYLIGAGVEDPAFQGRNSFSGNGELGRWVELCQRFDRVTVRGPRSAELLASVGVTAPVVGDPALLHEPATAPAPRDRLLGVNLGFGDDLWGHDHDRVLDAVADTIRTLATERWSSRLLVINPKDLPYARECARRAAVPDDRIEIRTTATVPDYLAAVGDCTVLVAERLHALVLGAAAGVPLVGLEYQPKVADFLASVGAGEWSCRTDDLDATGLCQWVEALAGRRDGESARLAVRVGALRGLLRAELDRMRGRLGATAELAGGAR